MTNLIPFSLKDAPALIETVFPAQKVSYEAQRERKAGAGQTLTALGSYWKGRKPLILVRSIILGSLLPPSNDRKIDLDIFEKLMALDEESLAKRAYAQNALKPNDLAAMIHLRDPWDYFVHGVEEDDERFEEIERIEFPIDCTSLNINLRWQRGLDEADKIKIFRNALQTIPAYEDKASLCKRPEELDPDWLYSHIWLSVNDQLGKIGVHASTHVELVKKLGTLRYGRTPRLADTFCGGGSIPFEAARLGCEIHASDLNPIAAMLTWGALNIIAKDEKHRAQIELRQAEISVAVDEELTELGVEHDEQGNRAKAYLYCLETRCPQTGWMVPLLPSRLISFKYRTVAYLLPDFENKRFEIDIREGVSNEDLTSAKQGTVQDGELIYELQGKVWRTSISTLRGDYRDESRAARNGLRLWTKSDFKPQDSDVFQERLYAIQWITKTTVDNARQVTYFRGVTDSDMHREREVEKIVAENLSYWQSEGLTPDMEIEPGTETTRLGRERGWTHWHHLFNARALLVQALKLKHGRDGVQYLRIARDADRLSKLCRFNANPQPSQGPKIEQVFSDQALNPLLNYGTYSFIGLEDYVSKLNSRGDFEYRGNIENHPADAISLGREYDLYITDPPYADAVNYHEITEFFIAWLRRNPPEEFRNWTWDSRRALAIKGSGDDFRKGMVDAYGAMAEQMPDNGMQCVMFTHQDTGVWSDMVGIFWAAGLQVIAAWYIATETTSELKKGGYVQGTVILMLRKRQSGEKSGFKQRILPAVRTEVERQIESMMNLNEEVKDKLGEPVFNDSDLQMAGYAAALKVLTAYTQIGGEDVTNFALRPRQRGEVTVVDEIVQQAAEAANSLLVPEGLGAQTWARLTGVERFFFRMMDMETTGAKKLDNYQNFAKAFRVEDYARIMGDMAANNARLKSVPEFASRDLTDSTEIGPTWLGQLIIGLQQLLAEVEPQVVVGQIQADLPEFMEARPLLIDMLAFIERKASQPDVRSAAEVLGARMKNLRALGQ